VRGTGHQDVKTESVSIEPSDYFIAQLKRQQETNNNDDNNNNTNNNDKIEKKDINDNNQ